MAAKGKKERPKEDRRARFAQEYAKDFNATQAAIRSGYAAKSAHVTGSRLLSDAKVQAIIQGLHAAAAVKSGITIERVQRELARIAFSDARTMYRADGSLKPPHEWDDDTAAAVAGIEANEVILTKLSDEGEETDYIEKVITRKVKRWDKGRALSECVQILGMGKSINPAESGGLSITIIPHSARK